MICFGDCTSGNDDVLAVEDTEILSPAMSFLRANGEGTEDRKKTSIKQSQLKLFNNWKVQHILMS